MAVKINRRSPGADHVGAGWLRNGSDHRAAVPGPARLDVGLPRDVLAKGLQPITPCLPASPGSTTGSKRRSSTDRRINGPDSPPSPAAASTPAVVPGFYAAMNLNIKKWKLLDLDNPNYDLLLPILIYCVDKRAGPSSASPGRGPRPRTSSSTRRTKTSPSSSPPSANSTTSPVMTIRSDRRRRADQRLMYYRRTRRFRERCLGASLTYYHNTGHQPRHPARHR